MLASVETVHLWFSGESLKGSLRFRAIRFWKPRFILHRNAGMPGEGSWQLLSLPSRSSGSLSAPSSIDEWQVRGGRIEIWDHAVTPTTQWEADQFNGAFFSSRQAGALTGRVPQLGRWALLDLHYDGTTAFPLQARLSAVEFGAIQSLFHTRIPALEGVADFRMEARFQPTMKIQAELEPVLLPRLNGRRIRGHAIWGGHHLHVHLQSLASLPMIVALEGGLAGNDWTLQTTVKGYDTALVRGFYSQAWLDRLEGPGSVEIMAKSLSGSWNWSATGRNFEFEGTGLRVPEWNAQGDPQHMAVGVQGTAPEGGTVAVVWSLPSGSRDAALQVDVSSMTVEQVLGVFHWHTAVGYEPWVISEGSIRSVIHDKASLEVQDGDFTVGAMHLTLSGTFDLATSSAQAHLEGELKNIPVQPVLESFLKPPSPVTGTGKLNFEFKFSAEQSVGVRSLRSSAGGNQGRDPAAA